MIYLCKFDETGRRQETYPACEYTDEKRAEMIADGFIEISKEDWQLYCENGGNAYVRDPQTGKPVPAPPHVLTKAEKLAQLEWQYKIDKEKLKNYLVDAILSDDTEVITEIKEEMAEVEAQYQHDRKELESE